MQPTQALATWHDFYTLLGGASATMIGLLFVAASVSGRAFSAARRGPLRLFLSASVVEFGGVLAVCLIVLAPVPTWPLLGGMVMAGGVFGVGYAASAWRQTVHDGISHKIDMEDRIWYAVLPAAFSLVQLLGGAALAGRCPYGCVTVAAGVGGLLLAAVHNAWDITIWSVTQRKD